MTGSTAEDGTDRREGPDAETGGSSVNRSSRVARLARGLGGLSVFAPLAGCTSDGPEGAAPPTGTFPETGEGTPPGGPGTSTESELSESECRDRFAALEEEAETLRDRRRRLERWVESTERTLDNLERSRGRWETFGDDVVAAAEAVVEEARPAVVVVSIDSVAGHGTGWYVDDHHVLTNAHNVNDAPVSTWTLDGEHRDVTIVGTVEDIKPDVALLRTEEPAPATLPVDASAGLEAGDPLLAIGHPGGTGNWFATLGAYQTTLSPEQDPNVTYEAMITTVPTRGGSSGSPVLTLDGAVVGMTAGSASTQSRSPGQPPIPALDRVYDRSVPIEARGSHVPIAEAMELYERWT